MTDQSAENPRSIIGGNNPPLARSIAAEENFAETVKEFLEEEYRAIPTTVAELLAEAALIPRVIDNDDDMGKAARLIKRMRDETARIEAFRVKEKEPYLRGEQAVDGFMFGLKEQLARKERHKGRPGASDLLQSVVDDYNQRKLAAEQVRLRAERDRLAQEARDRAAEEQAARDAAATSAALAERARKPEIQAAHVAAAGEATRQATAAATESRLASGKAEAAHVATLAKPADMVRTRVAEGTTVTMATEGYAEIENSDLFDMAKLWPFINEDAKAKALRAWAKTTNYAVPMPGAAIGKRPKTVVR